MAITATPEPGAYPPRVRVVVARGSTVQGKFPMYRVDPSGATTALRAQVVLVNGQGQVFDYEAPYGARVQYRTLRSSGTAEDSLPVTLAVQNVWLVHPFEPSLSLTVSGASRTEVQFMASSFMTRTRPTNTAVINVLNRDTPITQRAGRRRTSSSSMTVKTHTTEQATKMAELVEDDNPVLLNLPVTAGWGLSSGWMQFGDVTDVRRDVEITDEVRLWELPYRVVGRPEGEAAPDWKWADVMVTYSTWADIEATYGTWADVEADRRGTG